MNDGSFIVYAYANSDVLTDMLTEVDGLTLGLSDLPKGTVSYIPTNDEETNYQGSHDEESNNEGTHWWWVAGGIAVAAVGIKAFNTSDSNVNTPTTGTVTITSTPTEDQTLTADTSALADADGIGSFTYQWQADNLDIVGATNATLTQAQVGKTITVKVIHTDALGTVEPVLTSAATAMVANVNDPTTGVLTITGTPAEDQTLTADTSALMDTDGVVGDIGSFTYQWLAGSDVIASATEKTLTLTQAQVGQIITVKVIHTDTLGTVEPVITSEPTAVVDSVTAPTQVVTIVTAIDNVSINGSAEGDLATGATTDDTTPTLSGTLTTALTSGQVLAIFSDGLSDIPAQVGVATVTGTDWTFTSSGLPTGRYSFTAQVVNSALVSQSPLSNAHVVNINSGISMTITDDVGVVAAGATTDDTTPTFSGTLTTALGADEELAIYDGTSKLAVATVNANNSWTFTPTDALTNGSYTFTAIIQAADETLIANGWVISAVTTITVEASVIGSAQASSVAPQEAMYSSFAASYLPLEARAETASYQATVTMQVNDDVGALTGKISAGTDTDDVKVSLTGTVTGFDADGAVQVYHGATLLGDATLGSTVDGVTSWSYAPAALEIGSHTIEAFSVDGAGTRNSVNKASTTFTVTATDTSFSEIATTDPLSGLAVQTYSLALTAKEQTLDFSGVHPEINVINIAGSGANTVKIDLDDVLQSGINLFNEANGWAGLVGADKHQLVVNGDADDTVELAGSWILADTTTTNSDHTYVVYHLNADNADGRSQVLIDQEMNVL